ncbi:MAG: hypothetical protein ABSG36_13495 [Acidimicrobiales bacterium]
MVALVVGGILLFVSPIANENMPVAGTNETVTFGCSDPFKQFRRRVLRPNTGFTSSSGGGSRHIPSQVQERRQ